MLYINIAEDADIMIILSLQTISTYLVEIKRVLMYSQKAVKKYLICLLQIHIL